MIGHITCHVEAIIGVRVSESLMGHDPWADGFHGLFVARTGSIGYLIGLLLVMRSFSRQVVFPLKLENDGELSFAVR